MDPRERALTASSDKFSFRHGCLLVSAVLGAILLWRIYLFAALAYDVNAVMRYINNPSNRQSGPSRLSVGFIASLTPPQHWDQALGAGWFDIWAPAGKVKPVTEIATALAQIPGLAAIEAEICRRTLHDLASPPATPPNKFPSSLASPIVNFRELREAARFWQGLARLQAAQGRDQEALTTLLGVLLMANHAEARDPQGLTLIARMITCAVRNIAAAGLIDVLPAQKLTRARAIEMIARIEAIEAALAPISQSFAFERSMLPSMAEQMRLAINQGQGQAMFGRNPVHLAARLAQPGLLDSFLDPLYQPLMNAATGPYPQIVAQAPVWAQRNQVLTNRFSTPGWHWFGYLWNPEYAFLDLLVGISFPNMSKALQQEFMSRQRVRGVAAAYGVTAYRTECGTWPANLAALASWTGHPGICFDLTGHCELQYVIQKNGDVRLSAAGEDAQVNTGDDIIFLPTVTVPQTLPPSGTTQPQSGGSEPAGSAR